MSHDATRRGLLAATAAALPLMAAGCKGIGALGTPPKLPRDVDVANAAIGHEVRLVASYRALARAHPALAPKLRPLAAHHEEHLARLRARLADLNATERAELSRVMNAHTAATGLPALAEAEQAAASWLSSRLTLVSSPSFAELLASIAASEAAHAQALAALRPRS